MTATKKLHEFVWINGTQRLIIKDKFGLYHPCLDDKDVIELNKKHNINMKILQYKDVHGYMRPKRKR